MVYRKLSAGRSMKRDAGHRPSVSIEPGLSGLDDLLRRCGIRLSASQLDLLWKYHKFLRARNPELNLTRIHNFTSMVHKHYADSILPALLTDLPSPLLDLGSGAGLPGIPLKIYRPDLKMVLAESRGNRIDFLASAVDALGLEGVEIVGKKITARVRYPVAGVISRAVLSIPRTLEAVKGCVETGGVVVLMKGPRCDDELDEAVEEFGDDFHLFMDKAYSIPGTTNRRRLVVFRRKNSSSATTLCPPERMRAVRIVESSENPAFKSLRKLCDSRGVRKAGRSLVSGEKLVRELIETRPEICEAWLSPVGGMPPPPRLPSDVEWLQLSPRLFRVIDVFGTGFPMLRARIPEVSQWTPVEGFPDGCSLLVPFQDPENVGAVIRSAVAFGAAQVILLAGSANPFHPKAIRASGGAVFSISLRSGLPLADIPEELPLVTLSADGSDITGFRFPRAFGLLAGVEGPGLPGTLRNNTVGIPIVRDIESLNAAVAVSVALYEWHTRRSRSGAVPGSQGG